MSAHIPKHAHECLERSNLTAALSSNGEAEAAWQSVAREMPVDSKTLTQYTRNTILQYPLYTKDSLKHPKVGARGARQNLESRQDDEIVSRPNCRAERESGT
jgi:hypothetical protein